MPNESDPQESRREGIGLYRALENRKRRIGEQEGRALEKLGHAIDYLIDEFVFEYNNVPEWCRRGRIESIQILMSVNRQIYFSCPEVPTLRNRILAILRPIRG